MPDKRNDKNVNWNTNTIAPNITDAELDTMLAQWAEADAEALDVEVPEAFHQAVMAKLRAMEEAPAAEPQTQKKGILISLAERFAGKKAWMGTAVAAALIICCLPILHHQQSADLNVADVQSPSNLRMMQQEVEADQAQTDAAPQLMMASLMDEDTAAAANDINDVNEAGGAAGTEDAMAKSSAQESANIVYDGITPEAQLTQLQTQLENLQNQLAALPDTADYEAQRTQLQAELEQLQDEITRLEVQIEEENTTE